MIAEELLIYFIIGMIVLMVTMIIAAISPFGILFIVFSIVRWKTKDLTLKTVSFILQVISSALTFLFGILVSFLLVIRDSPFYIYDGGWFMFLAVIFGVILVVAFEIGVMVWQTQILLKKKIKR